MTDTLKKMKIVVVVLAVLLGLSMTALAGVIIYGHLDPSNGSAVAPDNCIEPKNGSEYNTNTNVGYVRMPVMLCAVLPKADISSDVPMVALSKTVVTSDSAKETVISIYKTHAEDSAPFHCANMFPGDSENRAYLVEVSHKGTVTVRFHADIRAGYEKLSEVLKCKIILRSENKTLYDGLMRAMPESINHRITSEISKTTELAYDITVYLDTSVGNEHMNQELVADFRWWVEESGTGDTTDPNEGGLVPPPQTGDNFHFCIWFWIAMVSLGVNIILLWLKRRENHSEQEDVKANE